VIQIEIKSRPGTFIILDDEVAERIGHWGWCLNKDGYAFAHLLGSKPYKKVLLNRAVIWASTGEWTPEDMEVDHIHHDKLDNRMENLRVVPRSINCKNRLKREGASSEFQGVFWRKDRQTWIAKVVVRKDGKVYNIRSSSTTDEEIAGRCADCIRDLVGGWLPCNFHEESFEYKWERIGEEQRKQIRHSLEKNGIEIVEGFIT
jgi:hypothetical protein